MPKPNFFIVGAPRCGTTAMYEYLRQHPDIYMPYRKEPVYFGRDLHKRPPYLDEHEYLALFDAGNGKRLAGEATVWYLYSSTAAEEIKEFNPEARIIIMLRNPVDMIYSLHGHLLFSADEDIADFEQALAAEPDRAADRRVPSTAIRPEGLRYRWLARYSPHVRRYLDTFGGERVLVLLFDDLEADPAGVYRQTIEFLGADPTFIPRFDVVNRRKRVRNRVLQQLIHSPAFVSLVTRLPGRAYHVLWQGLKRLNAQPEQRHGIDRGLRRRLQQEFADDVDALERLIGRDLSHWSRT